MKCNRPTIAACFAVVALGVLASCATPTVGPSAPSASITYKDVAFGEYFRRTNGWVAGDGGLSVPLTDGRVLWLFGDSFVDSLDPITGTVPCLFQVRNTAMVQDPKNSARWETLVNRQSPDRTLFRHPEKGRWFWPVNGFQQGDAVYIYLTVLKTGGLLGFDVAGHAWGKMKFPELEISGYLPLPDFHGIDFGCGFVKDSSGYTYAFGSKLEGQESNVYVARFKTAQPEREWGFWDGRTWAVAATNAAVVGRAAAPSLHVCKIRGTYLLTSSELSVRCDQGKEIYVSTAGKPTGPFTPRKKIFTVDDTLDGHFPFFYLPVAHPEFINGRDELLITYNINGYEPCIKNCVNGRLNPDYYRLRAIRVPLKAIGPGF